MFPKKLICNSNLQTKSFKWLKQMSKKQVIEFSCFVI